MNKLQHSLDKKFQEAYETDDFWVSDFLFDFAEIVSDELSEQGLNQSEFAEMIGVSRQRLSNILGGNSNLTVKTMVKIAHALSQRLESPQFRKRYSDNVNLSIDWLNQMTTSRNKQRSVVKRISTEFQFNSGKTISSANDLHKIKVDNTDDDREPLTLAAA